jgi:hypothetical protein
MDGNNHDWPRTLVFIFGRLYLVELQGGTTNPNRDTSGRKKRRVVKSKGHGVSMVVGEDLKVGQIVELKGRTLVVKSS